MSETQTKLVEWLKSLETVSDAFPVTVKIGNTVYDGARYVGVYYGLDGDEYYSAIYLLGDLPATYKRSKRTVYLLGEFEDKYEWYIAGWAEKKTVNHPEYSKYHPFGIWFQLRPIPAGKIDEFEDRPHNRVKATVK